MLEINTILEIINYYKQENKQNIGEGSVDPV